MLYFDVMIGLQVNAVTTDINASDRGLSNVNKSVFKKSYRNCSRIWNSECQTLFDQEFLNWRNGGYVLLEEKWLVVLDG